MVGIDVIDADRRVAHARLSGTRRADRDLIPGQDLGTAGRVEAYCMGHGGAPIEFE
jgi:hypothetical protein